MNGHPRLKSKSWKYLSILALLLLVLLVGSSAIAFAQGEGTVEFSNVSDGTVISELTVLRGTITFPDFLKYEIFLQSGRDNLIWVGNSHSPVDNGNLVRLDPRVFADGEYQLVVRKVNSDSNYTDTTGPAIVIDNPLDTPAPYYPEVEPSFLYTSERFGIVRLKNCSGEEFLIDLQSGGFGDDYVLPGKTGDTICIFRDIALDPGIYQGSARGGAQERGQGVEINAQPGTIHVITYFGGEQVSVEQRGPDDMEAGEQMATATPKRATATPKSATATPVPPTAAPDKPTEGDSMLPETGQQEERSGLNQTMMTVGILVILLLGTGGFVAVTRRREEQN